MIPSPYIVLKIYHPVFILSVYKSFPLITLHTSVPAAETAGCINYDIDTLLPDAEVAEYLVQDIFCCDGTDDFTDPVE